MARPHDFRGARARAGLVLLLAGVVALAGCSSMKHLFTTKKALALKPAELVEFTPTAKAERVWSTSVGAGEGHLGARQGPTVADGRVYAGTTVYGGRVALRPAMTNWRTSERDVDFFIDVVRELGGQLTARSERSR